MGTLAQPRCRVRMRCWRHPFEVAPYAGAVAALPLPLAESELEGPDRALVRSLRPEASARWIVTLGSALFSVVLYEALWGWSIALGLVLGMAFHELGHALVMRQLGLPRSPIVFVPFIGAMQRLQKSTPRPLDLALLALAGPAAGLLFAAGCKVAFLATARPALGFLATAHAILALIDLLPFGALDGARVRPLMHEPGPARVVVATTLVILVGCACGLM